MNDVIYHHVAMKGVKMKLFVALVTNVTKFYLKIYLILSNFKQIVSFSLFSASADNLLKRFIDMFCDTK